MRRTLFWATTAGILLAILVALAVRGISDPLYQAEALLEANGDYVVFKDVLPKSTDLARTERGLLFNPIVLEPVLGNTDLRNAPSLSDPQTAEANLVANLSVASDSPAGRLVIRYTDTDPAYAAKVCNAIVDSYLRQRDGFDYSRLRNLDKWLEREVQRWEQEVEHRQRAVQERGGSVVAAETEGNLEQIKRITSLIADLKVESALQDRKGANSEDVSESDADLDSSDSKREQRRARLVAAQDVYQSLLREATRLKGRTAEIGFAEDELEVALSVLRKLRERVAAIRTERQKDGAVKILVPAIPPKMPINTFPNKKVAIASGAGFLLPFVIASLVGLFRGKPDHTDGV